MANPCVTNVLCSLLKTAEPDIVFLSVTKKLARHTSNVRIKLGFPLDFYIGKVGIGGALAIF